MNCPQNISVEMWKTKFYNAASRLTMAVGNVRYEEINISNVLTVIELCKGRAIVNQLVDALIAFSSHQKKEVIFLIFYMEVKKGVHHLKKKSDEK